MIVALISEPRTGSNNLVEWFRTQNTFDSLILPSYVESPNFQNGVTLKNYKFNKENLIIKEEFYFKHNDFTELIEIADYVIYLFRENFKEQVESWTYSKKTNNFTSPWIFEKNKDILTEIDIENFERLKRDFKETYLNNNENFKISYEDLYFNNGIEKIIKLIKEINLNGNNFPIGQKYRIDVSSRGLI